MTNADALLAGTFARTCKEPCRNLDPAGTSTKTQLVGPTPTLRRCVEKCEPACLNCPAGFIDPAAIHPTVHVFLFNLFRVASSHCHCPHVQALDFNPSFKKKKFCPDFPECHLLVDAACEKDEITVHATKVFERQLVRLAVLIDCSPPSLCGVFVPHISALPVVAGRRLCARGSPGFVGVPLLRFCNHGCALASGARVALVIPVVAGRRVVALWAAASLATVPFNQLRLFTSLSWRLTCSSCATPKAGASSSSTSYAVSSSTSPSYRQQKRTHSTLAAKRGPAGS